MIKLKKKKSLKSVDNKYIKYRKKQIKEWYYLNGCSITFFKTNYTETMLNQTYYTENFKPNGTGPDDMNWFIKFILRNLPSDKYQIKGSNPHDLMYTIGGNEFDRNYADKLMYKITKKSVFKNVSWYNPIRYVFWRRMKQNYNIVRWKGADSFNYNDYDFDLNNSLS